MSLKDWFGKGPKGDWVRMGTDGKIKGPCAREPGEGKPKCLPRSKASSMSLKDRAAAVRRKRREDPVADRPGKGGKPVMVKTKKEEVEYIEEKAKPTNPALWSRAKAAARAKFDVYPSAYANGWAVRWYKKRGGGWRDVAEEVVNEKCWDGYKQKGMKKKGDKIVPNCVKETDLGVMIAKAQSDRIKRDWNKKSRPEKLDSLKKTRAEIKKRMEEGKNHSWKSEGHYTKDGKEWKGPQHAHDGQVMTGEKHTADSQNLYHFKALSKDVQKKVLAKMNEEKGSRDGKYTEHQKAVQRAEKKRAEQAKKHGKTPGPHFIGQRTGVKASQLHKQPGYRRTHKHGSQYGPAVPDSEAIKRRKAIERHQERQREKDYWDDDFVMTGCPLLEKLNPSMGIGKYIKDFKKSDAPQFKGASAAKRRKMAVAAYLSAKRKKMEESIKYDSTMGVMDWGTPKGTEYMKDNTPGESQEACHSCEGAGCSHCDYRGTHSRKINVEAKEMGNKNPVAKNLNKFNKPATYRDRKNDYTRKEKHKNRMQEETEAGETKADYRKDNADTAPVLGDYALTKQDIKELEYEADHITWQQALDLGLYDDDEIEDDIDSTDPHDDVNITEVLSVQGRLKRKFAARKNRQKLKVARNIALRRGSSPDRLKKRAVRGARGLVYKRLLKGRDKSKMPPAEKARLEKMLKLYAPLMQRLAVRLLPNMRKMEISRMKNRKGGAAKKAKKYKAARPVAKASTQKAKKFKIKK